MTAAFGLPPRSVGPTPNNVPSPFERQTVEVSISPATPASSSHPPEQVSFAERVKEFMGEVNQTQTQALEKSESFARGDQHDIHGTMLSLQKADITLHFLSNIRNRLLEAYREVMRMGA